MSDGGGSSGCVIFLQLAGFWRESGRSVRLSSPAEKSSVSFVLVGVIIPVRPYLGVGASRKAALVVTINAVVVVVVVGSSSSSSGSTCGSSSSSSSGSTSREE